MRRILLLLGAVGTLVFGTAFLLSFMNPLLVESAAREAIRLEVQRSVTEKVDKLSQSKLITLAQRALGKTDADIEAARQEMVRGVPAKVASVVADMLNANCECRKRLGEAAIQTQDEHISSLVRLRERLVNFIEHSYASVRANLLREVRIFTGSAAVAFALLTLVALLRKGATLATASQS